MEQSRRPFAGLLSFRKRALFFLAILGQGIITSVVDNDSTGIAGYSIAGARFGYGLLWALLLSAIALAVIQEMAGRMGAVTGKGLADLIREQFGVRVTMVAMVALLVANATTVVAEFAGVAAAAEILHVSRYIAVPVAALVVWFLVVWGSYRRVERILLAGSAIFLVYIVAGFVVHPDWHEVIRSSIVPSFHFSAGYLAVFIGLIGTTITPWMQFYQQATVVDKGIEANDYAYEQVDIWVGALVLYIAAFFIIVVTGATLYVHQIPIDSAADAAKALQPLAGRFAEYLFAIGLLNASLMAAAVLPLSTSYALSEAFGWERGVNRGFREAPVFLGLYTGLIVFGALMALWPGAPLFILLWLPNVVGGILLPVILVLMLKLVNDRRLMGKWSNGPFRNAVAGSTAGAVVILTGIFLVVTVLSLFR
ncbi:MAG TPA: divalent metal cation transporter [Dehalococcoidia bacterium]|nr:divalent metal cation transporter [Dehalococcoidia bacterium]